MKKSISSDFSDDLNRSCAFEYGYYNDTAKDRAYFTKKYKNKGYKDIKVKRIATDTPGLKMYEISYIKSSANV